MANKKLANEQLEQLKKLVMEGKTPEDISKYFNIAVSSVHNYKRMLKEKGMTIPDVRGKRPTGHSASETLQTFTSPVSHKVSEKKDSKEFNNYMKLVINDLTLYLSPGISIQSIKDNVVVIKC